MHIYYVTGIDTGIGKSYATGILARYLHTKGESVSTMKLVQTGGTGFSEDIATHRKIMEVPLTGEDREGLSCPYLFPFPASPHLSARLEGSRITADKLMKSIGAMSQRYRYLLVEGTGGIYVPLNNEIALIDFYESTGYPVILVSSSRLGSINHTLMSLEIIHKRNIPLAGIIYNRHPKEKNEIADDSKAVFASYSKRFGLHSPVIEMPCFSINAVPEINCGDIFHV